MHTLQRLLEEPQTLKFREAGSLGCERGTKLKSEIEGFVLLSSTSQRGGKVSVGLLYFLNPKISLNHEYGDPTRLGYPAG